MSNKTFQNVNFARGQGGIFQLRLNQPFRLNDVEDLYKESDMKLKMLDKMSIHDGW